MPIKLVWKWWQMLLFGAIVVTLCIVSGSIWPFFGFLFGFQWTWLGAINGYIKQLKEKEE